uniref:Uncharacterized protein n=1 Tax=Anguilla anguilla TaxID=7936 RepID=A0A0E9SZN9_ANGAN
MFRELRLNRLNGQHRMDIKRPQHNETGAHRAQT